MRFIFRRPMPLMTAFALAAAPLAANPFTPAAVIDDAIAGFLGVPAGQPGGAARKSDPRLKLAACADMLDVTWYGRSGNTVQVSCASRGWRIFVPVAGGSATSSYTGPGARALVQRGETISLVFEGSGFMLTRQGEALEPGSQGQWIKIKPLGENAKPISGQVIAPGTVRVSAG